MADDATPREGPDEPERDASGAFGAGFPVPGFAGLDLSGLDLEQVLRGLHSEGPVDWNVARQVAAAVALEGADAAPAVAPADRAQLDELARAAQTLVVGESGLAATFTAPLRTPGPGEWAEHHLRALRPVLEALAGALRHTMIDDADAGDLEAAAGLLGAAGQPFGEGLSGEALAGLMRALAPMLLGVQAGSMVGFLARHALGRYDLPLPTSDAPSLTFVVANLDRFEQEWSLRREDLRFTVALHEVVRAAQRSVPWVQERLVRLAEEYAAAYEVDPAAFEARFGDLDPTDPASMARIAEHPEQLLGAMHSLRQEQVLGRIQAFTSVLEGYADTIVAGVARSLVPTFDQVSEAMKRHRVETGEAGRFVEGLLGLQLGRPEYERGASFCEGVVDRAGTEGLNRLWEGEAMLPTPSELEAPGLWLARIDLPGPA